MQIDIPLVTNDVDPLPRDLAPKPQGPQGAEVKNWAEDENVRNRIKSELKPILDYVRQRRRPLNDMWARMWKVWTLEHENQGYTGRSNIYAPAGKKGIETLVTQFISAMFPGEENFTVEKLVDADSQTSVEDVKALMQFRIENTAKLRSKMEKWARQLFVTGNTVFKTQYIRKVVKGKGYDKDRLQGVREYVLADGPTVEVVPVENIYFWPENVPFEESTLQFEDLSVPASSLLQKAAKKLYVESEVLAAIQSNIASEKQLNDTSKLQGQGITPPTDTQTQMGGYKQVGIVELFLDFDPTAGKKEEEKNPEPFLITLSGDGGAVLRCIPNPFWHKQSPYDWLSIGELPGRGVGTGPTEGIHQLQVLLNDQINQGMDCATWVLNPAVMYDPNRLEGGMPDMEPGMAIATTDVNSVRFDRPPPDLVQTTSILTTGTMGWIMDFIGAPPVLQGGSSPGRAFRTATGVGAANQNAKVPLTELVKQAEQKVLNSIMLKFFALDQQFAEQAVMVRLTGKDMVRVDPRTLGYNWNFTWSAATQTSNQQVKGQALLQAIQLLTSPPILMALEKISKTVNPVPMIQKLYTEVLGYRDFNTLIQDIQPGQPVQTPPAKEEPDKGFPGAEGEYTNETDVLMEPDHLAIRQEADALAASMGPMGASQVSMMPEDDGMGMM